MENMDGRGLKPTTIYMLIKTRNGFFPFDLIWNFVTFLWYGILPPVFFPLLLAVKGFEILKTRKVFLRNKRTEQAVKLLCAHGGSVGGENLPLKIEVEAGKRSCLGF